MNDDDIPSGNGIYIGPNAKGVTIIGVKSYGNRRSGMHIHKDSGATIVNSETFNNGLDGITVVGDTEYNLREILDEVLNRIDEVGLDHHIEGEVQAEVAKIQSQLDSPNPKKTIIKESLSTLRNILEGVAGNAVFQGLLIAISSFAAQL